MKNIEMLAELEQLQTAIINDTKRITVDEMYIKCAFSGLLEMLREAARNDEAKKDGRTEAKKAAEKAIKELAGRFNDYVTKWGAIHSEQEGKQIITNTYYAVRLNDPLPVEYGDENAQNRLKSTEKCIGNGKNNVADYIELEAPEIIALKLHIKERKVRAKAAKIKNYVPLYDFGDKLPHVNAEYLLQVLQMLGSDAVLKVPRTNSVHGFIYAESEQGDGILCPVKKA